MSALLEVRDLQVAFPAPRGEPLMVLRGVDLPLNPGERLGIVGESGAGKSMLGLAILNLLPPPGRVVGGTERFDGQNLLALRGRAMRAIQGKRISMIFQDPMATLNPVMTVGAQMVETLAAHERISARRARERSVEMLAAVQVPNPETRFAAYPHELSGGLRQRVVIAIALLTEPEIVIADEPTTALDVTIQAENMALLVRPCRERQVGFILITHDLGVVAEVTETLMILYAGQAVETGPTRAILDRPRHPYSAGLLAALPARTTPGAALHQIPGSMPSIGALPVRCPFRQRCERAYARCFLDMPKLVPDETEAARSHACYLPLGSRA